MGNSGAAHVRSACFGLFDVAPTEEQNRSGVAAPLVTVREVGCENRAVRFSATRQGRIQGGAEWEGLIQGGVEWEGLIQGGAEWERQIQGGAEWETPLRGPGQTSSKCFEKVCSVIDQRGNFCFIRSGGKGAAWALGGSRRKSTSTFDELAPLKRSVRSPDPKLG